MPTRNVHFKFAYGPNVPASSGQVFIRPTVRVVADGQVNLPVPVALILDANGEASADLEITGDLSPFAWRIDEAPGRLPGHRDFAVPAGEGTLEYADAPPADPAPDSPEWSPVALEAIAARDAAIASALEAIASSDDAAASEAAAEAAAASVAPGVAGGTATLDGLAKVPEAQVPDRLSAATLTASFSKKFHVNVTEYGAAGDWNGTTGTDNFAPFTAAIAACASGGTVFVPPGRYYFSDTLILDKCVDLDCGRGGFQAATPGTQLTFAAGKTGIWVKKNGSGIRPSGFRIGSFEIQSLSTAAGTDIGILMTDGQGTLDFTTVNYFGSHGFALQAGAQSPYTAGNVNNSYLNRVRAYGNRGDGILLQGNDSQAHIVVKADVVANYGWGINLDRVAHTVVIAPHADQTYNGSPGAFRDNGSGNQWQQVYSETAAPMLLDTNSLYANISTTPYARPAITDSTATKTALRVDAETGQFKQIAWTGVSGGRSALDVDQYGTNTTRLRQILPTAKDIFIYSHTSGTFSLNAPMRINGLLATTPIITSGTGSPEGVSVAPPGSMFLRTDGGAGTSHYIKESGTGNTGWVAK